MKKILATIVVVLLLSLGTSVLATESWANLTVENTSERNLLHQQSGDSSFFTTDSDETRVCFQNKGLHKVVDNHLRLLPSGESKPLELVAGGPAIFFLRMTYDLQVDYTKYYEGAFQYIMNTAVPANGGYKWAKMENGKVSYRTDYEGVTGFGQHFLEAYEKTGNTVYLDYAKGAATWLMSVAISEGDGYKWPIEENGTTCGTGHIHGVAGVGDFFLQMYKVLQNNSYKEYAVGAAKWLETVAVSSNDGYKWHRWGDSGSCKTGWCVGAAGITQFFYRMYLTFNDPVYLEYANGGLKWLISMAFPEAGGYKWCSAEDEDEFYTIIGRGAAGIGYIFLLGYTITGNLTYLQYAVGAAEWLKAKAILYKGGYVWPEYVGADHMFTGPCRGIPGMIIFFIDMWNVTGDNSYKEYAEGIGKFFDSEKISRLGRYTWYNRYTQSGGSGKYKTDYGWGVSGVGDMLRELGKTLNSTVFQDLAKGTAKWLIMKKIPVKRGYAWLSEGRIWTFETIIKMIKNVVGGGANSISVSGLRG